MHGKQWLGAVVLLFGAELFCLGVMPVAAQQLNIASASPGTQLPLVDNNGNWVFRRQVNEVTVMFTATRKGKYITDLQRGDVQVRDDKKPPAEVMDFR
ncbi:MAG TPA: hypothetical protein VFU27_13515, partial [Terriglobales bacterium]|nr:hypothetical protein [Terriglobales bacterium]